MSNKDWDKLNVLDRTIRQTSKCGMDNGTVVVIEFISGFELFNTRPYHNYETWGQGYLIHGRGFYYKAEDLDDAINGWSAIVNKANRGEEVEAWHKLEHLSRDNEPYRAAKVISGE